MLNTNAVNKCNSERMEHLRQTYVKEFYGRLWLDALADKEIYDSKVDWLKDWYESYEPSKDANIDYLAIAEKPRDFLEFYAMEVQKNMSSFIDERKTK